ncbi:MAG: hypothetical protein JO227_23400, partial [Acetobacteraceae bacterium]|nr:hypothetical protein [Acetobacteraceae bacterium]
MTGFSALPPVHSNWLQAIEFVFQRLATFPIQEGRQAHAFFSRRAHAQDYAMLRPRGDKPVSSGVGHTPAGRPGDIRDPLRADMFLMHASGGNLAVVAGME